MREISVAGGVLEAVAKVISDVLCSSVRSAKPTRLTAARRIASTHFTWKLYQPCRDCQSQPRSVEFAEYAVLRLSIQCCNESKVLSIRSLTPWAVPSQFVFKTLTQSFGLWRFPHALLCWKKCKHRARRLPWLRCRRFLRLLIWLELKRGPRSP